jgi:hypothetical protein
MARAWTWMIAVSALGCGPSVILDTETDATSATSNDDDRGTDGSGMGPSTRGDATSAASDGTAGGDDDSMQGKLDVVPATTGDVCIDWASMGCAVDTMPGSLVHGGTPLGELPPMTWGFFAGAPLCDDCIAAPRLGNIYFVTDPSDIESVGPGDAPWPGLELRLDVFEGPVGEEITVTAVMRSDSEEAYGEAQITIDAMPEPHELGEPFDAAAPAYISGNVVSIASDGWSVHGTFIAAYCPQLNQIAICE